MLKMIFNIFKIGMGLTGTGGKVLGALGNLAIDEFMRGAPTSNVCAGRDADLPECLWELLGKTVELHVDIKLCEYTAAQQQRDLEGIRRLFYDIVNDFIPYHPDRVKDELERLDSELVLKSPHFVGGENIADDGRCLFVTLKNGVAFTELHTIVRLALCERTNTVSTE